MNCEIPLLSGSLPLIGHMLPFSRNPVRLLFRGQGQHGTSPFRFRLFSQDIYVFLTPEGNKDFFDATDSQLSRKESYRVTVPIFGKGVAFDAEPDVMDQQIRLLHPALRDASMRTYAAVMQSETQSLISRLGEAGVIDPMLVMNELTTAISVRCLFGEVFRSVLSADFLALYRDLAGGLNPISFVWPYAPTIANKKRDMARKRLTPIVAGLVRKYRASPGSESFLQTLIDARSEDGEPLSDHLITGLLLTIIFAAQSSTSISAAWTGLCLARYPEWQRKIRDEALNLLDEQNISIEAVRQQTSFQHFITEVERLYPPNPLMCRVALEDVHIAGTIVPKGSVAMVSPVVFHRLESVFENANDFNPDRFLSTRGPGNKPPSLIGFGGGRHRCLGVAFAYMAIKVMWSVLLREYEVLMDGELPEPNYSTLLVEPRAPRQLRYRKRLRQVA